MGLNVKTCGAMLSFLFITACGPIEPEPPLDADGEPIELPDTFDRWLTVESVEPTTHLAPRPVVRIRLSDHIDPDNFRSFDAVSLSSGGIRVFGTTRWDIASRTLTWRGSSTLVPGLRYRLNVNDDRLTSITGAPFRSASMIRFEVDPTLEVSDVTRIVVTHSEVERIVVRKCATCHRDPEWKLNPLTAESMVGEPSDQSPFPLVHRYSPAESYLIHKILPDYPVRAYGVQPPEWSGATPLTDTEIQTFSRWIESGAR